MRIVRYLPVPDSLCGYPNFWRTALVFLKFKPTKKFILAYLTEAAVDRPKRKRKYWERMNSRARIAMGYDGALNCGRDQEDWLKEAFGTLAHFLANNGAPPSHYFIEPMLEDEETPIFLKIRVKTFVFILYANHVLTREVSVGKVLSSSLITGFSLLPFIFLV